MTHLIHHADLDLSGLTEIQQHMIQELAAQVNAVCELGQATPDQAAEALRRLVDVIERLDEHNRRMARKSQ